MQKLVSTGTSSQTMMIARKESIHDKSKMKNSNNNGNSNITQRPRFKNPLYKGPHLNDTFVIFRSVSHMPTQRNDIPFPFFRWNFSNAFFFVILCVFFLRKIKLFLWFLSWKEDLMLMLFAYDRLINSVWSPCLLNCAQRNCCSNMFEHILIRIGKKNRMTNEIAQRQGEKKWLNSWEFNSTESFDRNKGKIQPTGGAGLVFFLQNFHQSEDLLLDLIDFFLAHYLRDIRFAIYNHTCILCLTRRFC